MFSCDISAATTKKSPTIYTKISLKAGPFRLAFLHELRECFACTMTRCTVWKHLPTVMLELRKSGMVCAVLSAELRNTG
jgi:hypothetical protein